MPKEFYKLKTIAKDKSEFRGHKMTNFSTMSGWRESEWQRAVCLNCGRPADVYKESEEITGTATVYKCDGVRK